MSESIKAANLRRKRTLVDGMGPEEAKVMAECDAIEYRANRGLRSKSKNGVANEWPSDFNYES